MRFILFRLWFVFIPLILYVLFIIWARGRAKRLGQAQPHLFDGPWIWAVTASALLGIGGLAIIGLNQAPGDHAVPVQLEPAP